MELRAESIVVETVSPSPFRSALRARGLLRIAWTLGALTLLPGCPNPNLYTTPRTLDPGQVQWQLAPEVIGATYNATTTTTTTNANGTSTITSQSSPQSFVLPMVPTFGARVGVADGFELGARLQNFDSLALDGKIRLLKGSFDVALDPGLQGFYINVNNVGAGVVYMHLPVLLGVNLSKTVSIVASPGIVYAVATASDSGSTGATGAATAAGLFGRFGLGLDIRTSKHFAIHPEVTVMREFQDVDATLWVAGLGFNFGAQPDYSDLEGGGAGDGGNGSGGSGNGDGAAPSQEAPSPAPAPASAPGAGGS